MHLEAVDRPDDPRLGEYLGLTDPVRRRRVEADGGFFIAESRLVVSRLLRSSFPLRSVLVTETGLATIAPELEEVTAPVYVVSRETARGLTGFDVHRGILASASRLALPAPEILAAPARVLLVLEDIADQVNMGALFRNGLALGADAVLLSPECCDPLYRRSVRVSMGAVLHLPFCYLTPWPEGLRRLSESGFVVVGLTPDPGAEPVGALAAAGAPRVALLLGAEGPGLTTAARAAVDRQARIPMRPGADSLNVATAAAVALDRLVADR